MGTRATVSLIVGTWLAAVAALSGCSSSSSAAPDSPASITSVKSEAPSAAATTGSTFGEPSGLWDIPREVQIAYFKAICVAPTTKFGYAGTLNEANGTCLTPNDMQSDVDFVMRRILASDAVQMLQSTQFMVAQIGEPVEGCPTLAEYSTVVGLTVTNDCVVAALQAMTTYLSN